MNDDIDWKALQARSERALAAMREAPVGTLEVLLDALGASLGRSRGETDWGLSVACVAWRPEDGALRRSRLLLRLRGTREALQSWQSFLASSACVQVQARLSEENELGMPQAWLEAAGGPSEDAELLAIREALLQPVRIEDPVLGVLTLDRALDWYEGEISWCDHRVRLTVSPSSTEHPEAAMQVARELLADAERWRTRVEDYAVAALLSLKNDTWLGDEEIPFDAPTFKSRMRLTSIGVSEGGGFSFWHDDGDLFWGHSILVTGDLASGPTDADIPG